MLQENPLLPSLIVDVKRAAATVQLHHILETIDNNAVLNVDDSYDEKFPASFYQKLDDNPEQIIKMLQFYNKLVNYNVRTERVDSYSRERDYAAGTVLCKLIIWQIFTDTTTEKFSDLLHMDHHICAFFDSAQLFESEFVKYCLLVSIIKAPSSSQLLAYFQKIKEVFIAGNGTFTKEISLYMRHTITTFAKNHSMIEALVTAFIEVCAKQFPEVPRVSSGRQHDRFFRAASSATEASQGQFSSPVVSDNTNADSTIIAPVMDHKDNARPAFLISNE